MIDATSMAGTLDRQPTADAVASVAIPGLPVANTADRLPAAFAPLVHNAWYVVADLTDVGRELRGITVLGEPLVMYRTEAGEAIVLDDRCAHRRFSLSHSKLVGDTIQCGYHGYTYDKLGACVWAPTLGVKPKFGVRRYPAVEAGPWLWVWMGDPERADAAEVPYPRLDPDETWQRSEGYLLNPGNYMLLIENFLDLTHLHFLHGAGISDLRQAETLPRSAKMPPNSVGWTKATPGVTAGVLAALAGGDPAQKADAFSTENQIGPSINYGYQTLVREDGVEDEIYPLKLHVTHGVTPRDAASTHQFFEIAFNRPLTAGIDDFRDLLQNVVFQEDIVAIRTMQKAIAVDNRRGTLEYGIPGDRFGIKMRQILRRMSEAEA